MSTSYEGHKGKRRRCRRSTLSFFMFPNQIECQPWLNSWHSQIIIEEDQKLIQRLQKSEMSFSHIHLVVSWFLLRKLHGFINWDLIVQRSILTTFTNWDAIILVTFCWCFIYLFNILKFHWSASNIIFFTHNLCIYCILSYSYKLVPKLFFVDQIQRLLQETSS